MRAELPIDEVVPDLLAALEHGHAVLQAAPGAGKTSRVPIELLGAPWLHDKRIIMLEPRRIAARAAAHRLASQLGERPGERVGHRMRNDTRVSAATRIEVVTEGVLTRMLQDDPSLEMAGVVIFDEFHERSLHADLGLAMALDAHTALRPDLRLLVMSATLEGARVASLLDDATLVSSAGRAYPVDTHYEPPVGASELERHVADVITRECAREGGDILTFLPGARWIRRVERLLGSRLPDDVVILPLHGSLPGPDQDRAIEPDERGRRKVILSTDIAETSLTIDGVRVVIDGGQRRTPRFDARSGLTRLETVRISKASADQRRGRAGRQGPGRCLRLWSEEDHRHLRDFDPPEIASADLSGLALELALWGAGADELAWLDAPPAHALVEANALLVRLGALDADGRITAHGKAMSRLGAEPRLSHMLVAAQAAGIGAVACDVAALLAGRDPLMARSVDLRDRLLAMRARAAGEVRHGVMQDARRAARRWRRQLGVGDEPSDPDKAGMAVALGFPDRLAQQRGAAHTYRLASGRGAVLPNGDALVGQPYLAVADVDGDPQGGRIHLAAPLDRADLDAVLGSQVRREAVVAWDPERGDVVADHETRLGALVLKREPMSPTPDQLAAAWAEAVATEGLSLLAFGDAVEEWRHRVAFARTVDPEGFPDLSDPALLATTGQWLAPHLRDVRRKRDLARLDLKRLLGAQLDWGQQRHLDQLAPTHVTVPSGSRVRIDYSDEAGPVVAVRLQELFGLTDTPTVGDGRVPVVLHLLSPAQRPVQVTTDLASFWRQTYPQVKAELMGRYPKHHWPNDPMTATPTNRTKRRS